MATVDNELIDLAKQSSEISGVPWEWILAQWQHETGNFTNWGSRVANNYGGMKQFKPNPIGIDARSPEGDNYQIFDSPNDYADYFGRYLKKYYPDAVNASNVDDYATALGEGGYYSTANNGIRNYTNRLQEIVKELGGGLNNLNLPSISSIKAGNSQPNSNPNSIVNGVTNKLDSVKNFFTSGIPDFVIRVLYSLVGLLLFLTGVFLLFKENTMVLKEGGKKSE